MAQFFQAKATVSQAKAACDAKVNYMHFYKDRLVRPLMRGVCVGLLALSVVGCGLSEGTQQRGYVIEDDLVSKIKAGQDVQAVLQTLGTPSTVSTVGNKTFYYISQTTEQQFRFTAPKVTDQRVLAVYFNKSFKVERIANYGLQDGVVFDFITRTTPTGGVEQSFVRNLFRGLGAFNPFGA
jgi:outer membrane protein assembly factor BamE (lipoprotein component of BamABCDE complex)